MKSKYQQNKWICYVSIIFFFFVFLFIPLATRVQVEENKHYESIKEVSLYIYEYDHLPLNFITKEQALHLFSSHIVAIENGYNIGGDIFTYDGVITTLTDKTSLIECDIYDDRDQVIEQNLRGTTRLVFSDDGEEVYLTTDHYLSFNEITNGYIQAVSNTFWAVFISYIIGLTLYFHHLFVSKILDKNTYISDLQLMGSIVIRVLIIVPFFAVYQIIMKLKELIIGVTSKS